MQKILSDLILKLFKSLDFCVSGKFYLLKNICKTETLVVSLQCFIEILEIRKTLIFFVYLLTIYGICNFLLNLLSLIALGCMS